MINTDGISDAALDGKFVGNGEGSDAASVGELVGGFVCAVGHS